MKRSLLLALLALRMDAVTVLFNDDFSAAVHGLDVPSAAVPGWSRTPSIDVVGPGLYDITSCHSETHCIDLDGTNGTAGALERMVHLTAGQPYLLTWWASGSQRDPSIYTLAMPTATMRVSLGSVVTDLTLPWNQPWAAWALPYTPATSGPATVRIEGLSNFFVGLLLDDVSLINSTNSAQMPEPNAAWLLILGLCLIAVRRIQ